MCCNDELSWWFTKRFNAFYLSCRKQPNPSQNFFYSHSLNFHLSGSPGSVSKQPTQLIVEAHNCHKCGRLFFSVRQMHLCPINPKFTSLNQTCGATLVKSSHTILAKPTPRLRQLALVMVVILNQYFTGEFDYNSVFPNNFLFISVYFPISSLPRNYQSPFIFKTVFCTIFS